MYPENPRPPFLLLNITPTSLSRYRPIQPLSLLRPVITTSASTSTALHPTQMRAVCNHPPHRLSLSLSLRLGLGLSLRSLHPSDLRGHVPGIPALLLVWMVWVLLMGPAGSL